MERCPDCTGNLAWARHYRDRGYRSIPILPGTKAAAVKWKRFQTEAPTDDDYRRWFAGTRNNIAILCGELVVVDVDSPNLLECVMQQCGKTPSLSRTPRGNYHLHFRCPEGETLANSTKIQGLPIDLRVAGGYAIEAGSRNDQGVPYEWMGELLPLAELPVIRIDWCRARTRRQLHRSIEISPSDVMVRRARGYLACIEGAISGQGGHARTFRVACKLTHLPPRGFGLTIAQAWPLFLEWNEQCEPPWSERELLHKLEDAMKRRE